MDEGILVTIAAGNDGKEGPFMGGSGSAGEHVLAVASVETGEVPAITFEASFTLDGITNKTRVSYQYDLDPWDEYVAGIPIVPLSFDTTSDNEACDPLLPIRPTLPTLFLLSVGLPSATPSPRVPI